MLQERFPRIVGPRKDDICYATTNRQEAVKRIAPLCDRLIVVGSPNSSNSLRLVEVAERAGCPRAMLVQRAAEIDWAKFIGITSARHHRRRLGAGGAGRGDHRRLQGALRRQGARAWSRRKRTSPSSCRVSFATGLRSSMAVYTEVADEELDAFIASYDIGALTSCKGIAEGVENSNYLVHTESRALHPDALREARGAEGPALFPRADGASCRARHTCPLPVHDREGRTLRKLAGRPAALITFLDGVSVRRASIEQCASLGKALGALARRRRKLSADPRQRLSLRTGGRSSDAIGERADNVMPRPRGRDRQGACAISTSPGRATCRKA